MSSNQDKASRTVLVAIMKMYTANGDLFKEIYLAPHIFGTLARSKGLTQYLHQIPHITAFNCHWKLGTPAREAKLMQNIVMWQQKYRGEKKK